MASKNVQKAFLVDNFQTSSPCQAEMVLLPPFLRWQSLGFISLRGRHENILSNFG